MCVVPLSQPSSRDLVYPLLGCFVSEKSSLKKNSYRTMKPIFSIGKNEVFVGFKGLLVTG